jgi:hypothetical protein
MTDLGGTDPSGCYEAITVRLREEFAEIHSPAIVSRCVSAAQHGAEDVTGSAPLDLVERIARKHLQVLAIVASERRHQITLRNAAT